MDDEELEPEKHKEVARDVYERWRGGESKSGIEIDVWNDATSHGKHFTAYVKRWLGLDTERQSGQTQRIEQLEALLRAHGVSPGDAGDLAEEDRLLAKAREAALAALRIYNDPSAGFRTESFIMMMVVAWNSIFQAILERDHVDYYERDAGGNAVVIDGRSKVLDTWPLALRAIGEDDNADVRANLDFFLGLRHQIAHRYLPALDTAIVGEAQAMLLNFEDYLVDEFGGQAALGDQLAVPLQLSKFRSSEEREAVRRAQAQLPTDIMDFLARHRRDVDEAVLRSPRYAMQVFLVPVTANRDRSADAVVHFVKPGEISEEAEAELQQIAVITKPRREAVASNDLLRVTEVVNLVNERLPFRFTTHTHTQAWHHYGVRPASDSSEPESTNPDFCRYDRLAKGYGYTSQWVEKLVKELSDPDVYERVTGIRPEPK